ncbi:quinol dehydrogenase ferredoxin subunit NapH [Thaumasiovibrio sp. DFM-14]|uniref:quinol dehydrogenase ferredoxin subunit NapH n=1 Tax=Thaumasiovibrio sp. DFM-14 TaxID=3384792 RepID=UPI0039A01CAC
MKKNQASEAGKDAVKRLGWWHAHRFLLLRRGLQLMTLLAFLSGPWFGVWLFRGNLSSSELLNTVPFTEPLLLMQLLASGHWPPLIAWIGALVVVVIYALLAPRSFCGWVCPMNIITDTVAWIRRKTGYNLSLSCSKTIRYYLLGGVIIGSAISGSVIWATLDPVAALHRGIIFGFGAGWILIAWVVVIDLLLIEHGWCGHLCPLGAMHGLISHKSPLRITVIDASACTQCMDCVHVCPEPQVLRGPIIESANKVSSHDCMSCGRCIDVCAERVLGFEVSKGAKDE